MAIKRFKFNLDVATLERLADDEEAETATELSEDASFRDGTQFKTGEWVWRDPINGTYCRAHRGPREILENAAWHLLIGVTASPEHGDRMAASLLYKIKASL